MAISHFSVKVGKVGKAQPHAAYIARQGQYASRLEKGELLEHTAAGNMPAWAAHNPLVFWQAADTFERANGSTYREYEIALPRELSAEQRRELVDDFIQQALSNQHAYQYAIHSPKAVDGHEQPHVHLMFCERLNDGIERDPDQYFKRYNSKHPERGGAEKANKSKDFATRQTELKQLRQRWEKTCNQHLENAGTEARIDMRSYHDQHRERLPEPKQHPKRWKDPEQRAVVLAFRATQKEQEHAQQALKTEINNPRAEIIDLEKARETRAKPPAAPALPFDEAKALQDYAQVWRKTVIDLTQSHQQQHQNCEGDLQQAQANLKDHDRTKPKKGWFEHQATHQTKVAHWQTQHDTLQTQVDDLKNTLNALTDYTNPNFASHLGSTSALAQLAHQQVKAHYPTVTQAYQQALQVEQDRKTAAQHAKDQAEAQKQEQETDHRKACADVLRSQNLEAIQQHPVLKETQRKIDSIVKAGRDRADAVESHARMIEKGFIRLEIQDRGMSR